MKILEPKIRHPLENHFIHKANAEGKPVCGCALRPYDWIIRRGKKIEVDCRVCKKEA